MTDDKKGIIPATVFNETWFLQQKKRRHRKPVAYEDTDPSVTELALAKKFNAEQRASLNQVAFDQGYINFDKAIHGALEYISKKTGVDVDALPSEQLMEKVAIVLRVKKDELQKGFLSAPSIFK